MLLVEDIKIMFLCLFRDFREFSIFRDISKFFYFREWDSKVVRSIFANKNPLFSILVKLLEMLLYRNYREPVRDALIQFIYFNFNSQI